MNEPNRIYTWHCPNCGKQVHGIQSKDGYVKVKCPYCETTMIRSQVSRRRDRIDMMAPTGMERL